MTSKTPTRIHAERDLPTRKPAPSDPFDVGADRAYPRAGVRQKPNGRWQLTLWEAPGIEHAAHPQLVEQTDPDDYPDRYSAFAIGLLVISIHRGNGTQLNGAAA